MIQRGAVESSSDHIATVYYRGAFSCAFEPQNSIALRIMVAYLELHTSIAE